MSKRSKKKSKKKSDVVTTHSLELEQSTSKGSSEGQESSLSKKKNKTRKKKKNSKSLLEAPKVIEIMTSSESSTSISDTGRGPSTSTQYPVKLTASTSTSHKSDLEANAGIPNKIIRIPYFIKIGQVNMKAIISQSLFSKISYISFLGIPYAKPPINDLRFMPPQRHEALVGNYDASFERNECIQQESSEDEELMGNEDCLYLNIHVPRDPREIIKPLPVMVYIHGGGFLSGSGSSMMYGPDHLMNFNIILVTFNYRLHIFGFLNMNIPECPGNVGMKDQVMVLQWVKENIKMYGGNPDNVTIFGSSAGAAAVNFHMISPLSKGLFHKAILQSGNVYCPWGLAKNASNFTRKLIRRYSGNVKDPMKILKILRKVSSKCLTKFVWRTIFEIKNRTPLNFYFQSFGPVVECVPEDAFLPAPIEQLMKRAQPIPIIVGINNYEGLLAFRSIHDDLRDITNEHFSHVLVDNFPCTNVQDVSSAVKKIKNYYFHNKPINRENTNKLAEVSAAHSDELGYIFAPLLPLVRSKFGYQEKKMTIRICEMWTNFAKTGYPTNESMPFIWEPSTRRKERHLEIGKYICMQRGKVNNRRFAFMEKIVKKLE
ncbi:hypothetical protein PGB90_005501 [Kerria lacca]